MGTAFPRRMEQTKKQTFTMTKKTIMQVELLANGAGVSKSEILARLVDAEFKRSAAEEVPGGSAKK